MLDEIDKTKIDDVVRNEDFMTKNVRVKPIASRLDRMRSLESPLNSKRSMHQDDNERPETEGEEGELSFYSYRSNRLDANENQESLEPHRLKLRNKTLEV